MAVPKKKVSRSRRNMRRFSAAYQLETPTYSTCPTCNEPVRTHRVCNKPDCYNAYVASRSAKRKAGPETKKTSAGAGAKR